MKTFREYGLELIGQESGFSFDVTLNGHYVYSSASWDGLRILDISDPIKPTNIGSIKFSTHTSRTFVNNDIAYIAEGQDEFELHQAGIRVIDVSNKTKPTEMGHVPFNDFTDDVVEKDGLIYALVSYGAEPYRSTLEIIEFIPPSTFSIVASHHFEHRARRIVIANNYAFLAGGYAGVQVLTSQYQTLRNIFILTVNRLWLPILQLQNQVILFSPPSLSVDGVVYVS